MADLTVATNLDVTHCWCGMPHAIPHALYLEHYRTGRECYCPLGHSYVPADRGENARLRRELEEARGRIANLKDNLNVEAAAHTRTKRQYDRLIKTGVCPCCRRNFVNLRQHMAKQHPDYSADS